MATAVLRTVCKIFLRGGGYLDPAHAVVGQEAGDAAHAELAVCVAGGAGDLLWVLLAPLQTRLAEGVETWQHLHTKCFRWIKNI